MSEDHAHGAGEPGLAAGAEHQGEEQVPLAPLPPAGGPRWWRRRATSAAAAVVALALVAVGAFALGRGSSSKSGGSAKVKAANDANKLLEQGLTAQSQGRLDEARASYQKAVDEDPTNKIAYYNLGVIYQQLNAVVQARNAYNRALQIDAKYQPALFNLAVLETSANPTQAVSLYRRILDISPKDANVHLNLGLLLKQIGRNNEGDVELNKALQIDPSLASRLPPK